MTRWERDVEEFGAVVASALLSENDLATDWARIMPILARAKMAVGIRFYK